MVKWSLGTPGWSSTRETAVVVVAFKRAFGETLGVTLDCMCVGVLPSGVACV